MVSFIWQRLMKLYERTLSAVALMCNLNTWEAEAEDYHELKCQSNIGRPCPKPTSKTKLHETYEVSNQNDA